MNCPVSLLLCFVIGAVVDGQGEPATGARKLLFEEVFSVWTERRLTQEEAAQLPGNCPRTVTGPTTPKSACRCAAMRAAICRSGMGRAAGRLQPLRRTAERWRTAGCRVKPCRRARGARRVRHALGVAGIANPGVPGTGNAEDRLASSRYAAPPLRCGPAGDPSRPAAYRPARAVSKLPALAGRCTQERTSAASINPTTWMVGEETRFCCRSALKSRPCGLQ